MSEDKHFFPQRKNVQFTSMSELFLFEHSPSKTWYTEIEYQRFKQEVKVDIMSVRKRLRETTERVPNIGSYCLVGIEQAASHQGMNVAVSFKKIVIQAVLLEQKRQRVLGYHDPDQIAVLSESLTAESCKEARKRGKFQELVKFV